MTRRGMPDSGSGSEIFLVLLCHKQSSAPYAANGAAGELLEKMSGELDAHSGDGIGIMTLGPHAGSRGA